METIGDYPDIMSALTSATRAGTVDGRAAARRARRWRAGRVVLGASPEPHPLPLRVRKKKPPGVSRAACVSDDEQALAGGGVVDVAISDGERINDSGHGRAESARVSDVVSDVVH